WPTQRPRPSITSDVAPRWGIGLPRCGAQHNKKLCATQGWSAFTITAPFTRSDVSAIGRSLSYIPPYEGNHQGKDNVLLFPTVSQDTKRAGPLQCRERLGGLLKHYTREAA